MPGEQLAFDFSGEDFSAPAAAEDKRDKIRSKFRFRTGGNDENDENSKLAEEEVEEKKNKKKAPPRYKKAPPRYNKSVAAVTTGESTSASSSSTESLNGKKKKAPPRYKRANAQQESSHSSSPSLPSSGSSAPSRSSSSGQVKAKAKRGAVRVNPVTGQLMAAEKTSGTRDGCLTLPEHMLYAAADAGLGSGSGMYSHIGALRKELNGAHNTGKHPSAGGTNRGRKPKAEKKIVYSTSGGGRIAGFASNKQENTTRVERNGGANIAGFGKGGSTKSKPRAKIRHSVQG